MDSVDKKILESLQKRISQYYQKERETIERSRKEREGLKKDLNGVSTSSSYPEDSPD